MRKWGAVFLIALPAFAAVPSRSAPSTLFYVETTAYPYDQYRPWKRGQLKRRTGYGCAVEGNLILVPAHLVADATAVRVQCMSRNEFLAARVVVADYDCNLALLSIAGEEELRLSPVRFKSVFKKGAKVSFERLSRDSRIETGRGELDEAKVLQTRLSYVKLLTYVIKNASEDFSNGELCRIGGRAVGIAAAAREGGVEVIPAEVINHFLQDRSDGAYDGFPHIGFEAQKLLDPAFRRFLKMPESLKQGIYVADVFTIGTGSDVLRPGDVILAIDGRPVDAHGRYADPVYGQTLYRHLISMKKTGDPVEFDLYREGKRITVRGRALTFKAEQMLVPYYEFDKQPRFVIVGGFVLQRLTRQYLRAWGEDFASRVMPELVHYVDKYAFKPTRERSEIIVLSYVIPTAVSMGYHNLRQRVVKRVNGKAVGSIREVVGALEADREAPYDVIELEYSNPTVVVPKAGRRALEALLSRRYGVRTFRHVD